MKVGNRWLRLGSLVVFLGAITFFTLQIGLSDRADITSAGWQTRWWAPVAVGALYALCTLTVLPKSVLTIAAGAVLGFPVAVVTVLVGATVGATLAFFLGRGLARGAVETLLGRYRQTIDDALFAPRCYGCHRRTPHSHCSLHCPQLLGRHHIYCATQFCFGYGHRHRSGDVCLRRSGGLWRRSLFGTFRGGHRVLSGAYGWQRSVCPLAQNQAWS